MKNVKAVIITVLLALAFGWLWSTIPDDPLYEEYGPVTMATDFGEVRVKDNHEFDGTYQVYLCRYNADTGAVTEIIGYGAYQEPYVQNGIEAATQALHELK